MSVCEYAHVSLFPYETDINSSFVVFYFVFVLWLFFDVSRGAAFFVVNIKIVMIWIYF